MKTLAHSFYLTLLGVFILGCSTQKNNFFNREYHALNTKFNVLFNGNEALEIGKAILYQNRQDDFLSVLPVEPISLNGEDQEQTASIPSFTVAEEKAVKAIQKHSMNIGGMQRNREIQKAYLLLGKARYFDRRFVPALEAFNFLLEGYDETSTYYEGKLWREKTNLRLGNNALAIDNLKPLVMRVSFQEPLHASINATIAQAYLNLQNEDSARVYITRAAMAEKDNITKMRYRYIEAQLLERVQLLDSAKDAYQSIVNWKRKAPRIFWMQAKLQVVRLQAIQDSVSPLKRLERLAGPFENQPYLHLIRQQQARYLLAQQQDSLALIYYNKSLKSPYVDPPTRQNNYRELADFYFQKGAYVQTGAYLDSLIAQIQQEGRLKKAVIRERKGLDDVIRLENIIKTTDSLLYLVALSPNEQKAYFEATIEQKRQAELNAINDTKKGFFNFKNQEATRFYFYNERLLVAGKQSFLSSWGNRPNIDNWNRKGAGSLLGLSESNDKTSPTQTEDFFIESADYYTAQLPQTPDARDSLALMRKQAYLDVGILYKEKFSNTSLALQRLDKVLHLSPTPNQEERALYHSYKLVEKENPEQAELFKSQLLTKFPDSAFSQILKDPENFTLREDQTPSSVYQQLYKAFQEQHYSHVLTEGNNLNVLFSGTAFAPKIYLLQSYAKGRLHGKEALEAALNDFLLRFPNAEEIEYVQNQLSKIRSEQSKNTMDKTQIKSHKWVFAFSNTVAIDSLAMQLREDLKEEGVHNWKISEDVYDEKTNFIVVHTKRQYPNQAYYRKRWREFSNFEKQTNNFVLLSAQYEDLQQLKTLSKQ